MKDPLEDASVDLDRRRASLILVLFVVGIAALAIFKPSSRDALAIVGGIILMVMLHEAGHFVTARRAGMKATEFFLGFGPRLWSFKKGDTEFGVKAIPAGGYVRIIGMTNIEPIDPEDEPRTFRRASFKDRLIVVLAGVTVNALLALFLFWVVIAGHGINDVSTSVYSVVAKSAAAEAGFKAGDKIVAVDGHRISGWDALKHAIESRGGQQSTFTVVRHGKRIDLIATPKKQQGLGFLGIAPATETRHVGVFEAVPESFRTMGDITAGTATGIGHLFSPSGIQQYSQNFTSNAPKAGTPAAEQRPRSLIGIVDEGSHLINGNPWALLWLLGGISLILALFNTLPLLPFDGGHAAVVVYEWVASKVTHREVRVDYRRLMPMTAVVLAIFLTLGLSAMFLDIRQAFGS